MKRICYVAYFAKPVTRLHGVLYNDRVIDGWDVLESLEAQPVKEKYRPLNDICIRDVTIHANPIADGLISKVAQ